MSHNARYQNNFVPNKRFIEFANCLMLRSTTSSPLNENSYNEPRDAILVVTDDIYEDIVFDGIVHIESEVEYENITCKHIAFGNDTVCVVSKINAYSIDASYVDGTEFSFDEKVVSFIGKCESNDIKHYFPNLIINSYYNITDGQELMYVKFRELPLEVILNSDHEYYSTAINCDVVDKYHSRIGNITLHKYCIDKYCLDKYIPDRINSRPYRGYVGLFLTTLIDFINENAVPLIKNANK